MAWGSSCDIFIGVLTYLGWTEIERLFIGAWSGHNSVDFIYTPQYNTLKCVVKTVNLLPGNHYLRLVMLAGYENPF